ncbi:MAG: preprotein translocase subunit YajC [Chitinophagaceae bacterium]|jgi:preprotein translocase subunit YajC|nr:preprotein translocase subunit YajC [Chitinophagaceae bacterium]OQY95505.1 MAG: preprotein translocase subunit YajC [Sphingobacteriales bacterium UTBCD1]
MKSIYSYLVSFAVAISFTACVPPGAPGSGGSSTGQNGGAGGFGGFQFIFLGLMIVVFWLFFIRPQAKKAKNQKNFISGLQKGDKIVTIAGIHGTINKINEDNTLNLEVSPGSYIKIEKSAISMDWTNALNKPAPAADKK